MLARIVASFCFSAVGIPAFAADGGTLKGSVKFQGQPPAPAPKPVPLKDQQACACQNVPDETLVVDPATKGIQWSVVRIMDVKADPPKEPFPPATIDQKGCRFIPHAVIAPTEVDFPVTNSDAATHNVHGIPIDGELSEFNLIQNGGAPPIKIKKKKLESPGILLIKCDIHGWMSSLVVVHDPRFAAITPADGSFEIKNVPPAKYTVKIFQEALGEQVIEVVIKAGETTDVGEVKFQKK